MIKDLYSIISEVLVTLLIGIVVSFFVNRFFLKNASSFGKNKGGEQVRWAAAAKPPVGGMSFYATFIVLIISIGALFLFDKAQWSSNYLLLGLFVPITIGFFVGLADDSYNTSPLIKFAGQFFCGLFFILSGNYIHISGIDWFNYWFTMIWVVGMMNSINMLDNMDGIVSSVSIVSLGIALMIIAQSGSVNITDVILITGIIGSLIGFLFFNWNPAKIYMGDTGSQFLGAFLAWVSIQYFWTFRNEVEGGFQARQFLIPALAFIIPLIDTTTVTFRRLARKVSPFVGGRDHTTHHLAYLGIKDKNVVRIMIGISFVSAFVVYQIVEELKMNTWNLYKTLAVIVYYITVFSVIQYFYEVAKKKINKSSVTESSETIKVERLDEVLN
jgi:UDP-GlcNAc:undecaprenyl-phosphate/decaprenyl-phosphate GlcNAc-1-phosphate transferase